MTLQNAGIENSHGTLHGGVDSKHRGGRYDRLADPLKPEHERYFERFSDLLRRFRVPRSRVDDLREEFNEPPAGNTGLPCPYCFVDHRRSNLATLVFTGRFHVLQCEWCRSTIAVETGM